MRKLMILGTVLTVLALVFTGCPKEPDNPPQKTDPVYTSISLSAAIGSTALTGSRVQQGNAIVFTANVVATDGTNGGAQANRTYRIDVEGLSANVTSSAYTSGSRTITVGSSAPSGTLFTVCAVSLGDTNMASTPVTYMVSTTASGFVYATAVTVAEDNDVEELEVGEEAELTVALTPANATKEVSWSVYPSAAATIAVDASDPLKATLTAESVGEDTTVTVTVTALSATGTVTDTVEIVIKADEDYVEITAVNITAVGDVEELDVDETVALTAALTPSTAAAVINWTLSDTSAATLSATTGATVTLTANSVAADTQVTVSATAGGVTGTYEITINADTSVVPATAISIAAAGGITELESPATVVLTATLTPSGATDVVNWVLDNTTAATLSATTGASVTLTANSVAADTTVTISATAGSASTTTPLTITIKAPSGPTLAELTGITWKFKTIFNYAPDGAQSTSTAAMPSANGEKRYVVFNNEPYALIDADTAYRPAAPALPSGEFPTTFRDVTMMYIEQGFAMDTVNDPDPRPVGMEARVRISKIRESGIWAKPPQASWIGDAQGVMLAAFTDPDAFTPLDFDTNGLIQNHNDVPDFIGMRKTAFGQLRQYQRRLSGNGTYGSYGPGTGTNVSVNAAIPGAGGVLYNVELNKSALDLNTNITTDPFTNDFTKIEGFASQEYVYRIMRIGPSIYEFTVLNAAGTQELYKWQPLAGNDNNARDSLIGNDAIFFGFMVWGVEVEISDVKVYGPNAEGLDAVWIDPAVQGATPRAAEVVRVVFTGIPGTPNNGFGTGYVYDKVIGDFADLSITSRIDPVTVNPRTGSWTADGDVMTVAGSGLNATISLDDPDGAGGSGWVKYTPNANGGGVNYGEIVFNILGDFEDVESVAITTSETTVGSQGTLQMTYTVLPPMAIQEVTWEVFADDGTSATTDATISATGLLTAAEVAADVDVVVQVTTVGLNGSGQPETDTFTVKIMAPTASIQLPYTWNFGVAPGIKKVSDDTSWINNTADGTGTANQEPGYLPNGMVIDPTASSADLSNAGNGVRWLPGQGSTGGSAGIIGCLQTQGGSGSTKDYVVIKDVQGPFKVTVTYGTGSAFTGGARGATLFVPYTEATATVDGTVVNEELATNTEATVEYTYSGDDIIDIGIGCVNAIRIFQVEIEEVQ